MRHVALDLTVDFQRRTLSGSARLDLERAADARTLLLDTRRLTIHGVNDAAGAALHHIIGAEDSVLGSSLAITLPASTTSVLVHYTTAENAEALQWLDPEQTAGGEQPFLFTQGHAIQTRSWIPLQDSPAIRVSYEARITVPAPLVAIMSAEQLPSDRANSFLFRMQKPIPSYLIALAVGDLATRRIGPRTAVFAEPALIDRAEYEFGEMESMIQAAEALLGPYLWGRFDVLVMPPSFPYGGMENPRLTFASATLLAGDRSLTTVIAHELAHAWAGNLVTNATWDDFWINEGTTVYLELRINEALWGAERAAMLKSSGFRDLSNEIARMGVESADTRLRYEMKGRDPAEGVTVVPYLKGAAFFWTLEKEVGREQLDRWLKSWFERHAFESVTTATLLEDLRAHLLSETSVLAADLERWVSSPGVPTEATPPASQLLVRVDAAAQKILEGAAPSSLDTSDWNPQAWRHFLGTLFAGDPSLASLKALDIAFGLSNSKNAEVQMPWLRLLAKRQDQSAAQAIDSFLANNGRMKYLRPLYSELMASPWGTEIAKRTYARARPRYHTLVQSGLDRLVLNPRA